MLTRRAFLQISALAISLAATWRLTRWVAAQAPAPDCGCVPRSIPRLVGMPGQTTPKHKLYLPLIQR